MSKEILLKNLFDKWKTAPQNLRQHNFISDGIVDEIEWNSQKLKVLFILKEANDPDPPDAGTKPWDLREFLRGGAGKGGTPTFGMLSRWVYGISNEFCSWIETQKKDFSTPEERKKWLCKTAVMNIKKSGGGSSSDPKQLELAAQDNAKFIKEEIEVIKPKIIVACGTYNLLKQTVYVHDKNTEEFDEISISNGIECLRHKKERWLLLDFYHPAARVYHNFLYTMLIDAIKEAKKYIDNNKVY